MVPVGILPFSWVIGYWGCRSQGDFGRATSWRVFFHPPSIFIYLLLILFARESALGDLAYYFKSQLAVVQLWAWIACLFGILKLPMMVPSSQKSTPWGVPSRREHGWKCWDAKVIVPKASTKQRRRRGCPWHFCHACGLSFLSPSMLLEGHQWIRKQCGSPFHFACFIFCVYDWSCFRNGSTAPVPEVWRVWPFHLTPISWPCQMVT